VGLDFFMVTVMRNYPEYPDNDDVAIKDMAESCGLTDFARAREIVQLIRDLRLYGIQDRRFVREALRFYTPEFIRGNKPVKENPWTKKLN
jgi:hypothetical protein